MDTRIYEMQAGVCVALGNAKRIQIIDLLQDGEKTAGSLREAMGIPKANLSQHLNVMKSKGIVQSRRQGTSMYYRITNHKIITACQLMREVLIEQLKDLSTLHKKYTGAV
ncbi:MAG: winged helix-turn-helix transcriptional regulator [Candidatus Marinimicrobia bacterium]|nr:winged helix-turn-helix transcriptional regulator [Candidatus Neomarinimicrobiota bacterium]